MSGVANQSNKWYINKYLFTDIVALGWIFTPMIVRVWEKSYILIMIIGCSDSNHSHPYFIFI